MSGPRRAARSRPRGTTLTAAGRARLHAAAGHMEDVEEALRAGLDDAALAVVRRWLHDGTARLADTRPTGDDPTPAGGAR